MDSPVPMFENQEDYDQNGQDGNESLHEMKCIMRDGEALDELIPSKDDDQRRPDVRPLTVSAEKCHRDRKMEV